MGGWSATCERCKKTIEFKDDECDHSGSTWHPVCFACEVCGLLLNENSVKIRGDEKNRLFCSMHKFVVKGTQVNDATEMEVTEALKDFFAEKKLVVFGKDAKEEWAKWYAKDYKL